MTLGGGGSESESDKSESGESKKIFSIPPSKYIVPRTLYPMLNITDVPGLERTWLASAGPGAFGLGQKWLENFYTAYDSEYTLFFFFFSFFF